MQINGQGYGSINSYAALDCCTWVPLTESFVLLQSKDKKFEILRVWCKTIVTKCTLLYKESYNSLHLALNIQNRIE